MTILDHRQLPIDSLDRPCYADHMKLPRGPWIKIEGRKVTLRDICDADLRIRDPLIAKGAASWFYDPHPPPVVPCTGGTHSQ